MKVLFGIYMALVVTMFIYVGITCIAKSSAPASGIVGLIFAAFGIALTLAVLRGGCLIRNAV